MYTQSHLIYHSRNSRIAYLSLRFSQKVVGNLTLASTIIIMHLVHVKTHKNKHIYSFNHIVTMFSSIKKQCIRLGQSHIILSSLGVGPAPPVNVVVVPVVVLSVDPVVVLSVLSVTVVVVLEVRSRHSCSTPFLVIFWSLQVSKNLKSIAFFYSSTFLFLQGVH